MQRWWIPILTCLLTLALPAALLAQPASSDDAGEELEAAELARFYGRTVSFLKFEIPRYMDDAAIKRVSKIDEGKPFDRWRVRSTLHNFYLLGDIANTAILAKDGENNSVKVTITIYPRYIIRDIRVVNNFSFNAQEVLDEILHVEPGDDWYDENETKYKKKIQDAMARVGHLKAEVKIDVDRTDRNKDNKVDLRLKFNERQKFKVSRFDLTGAELSIYSRDEILKVAKWKDGMDFNQDRIDAGLARLKKWLFKAGHREARIPDLSLDDPDGYGVDLEKSRIEVAFPIKIGPRVDIYYDNECFTCAEMKWRFTDLLGLKNQKRFNEWIAKDFAKRIRIYFQRQGYYLAETDFEFTELTESNGLKVKRINLTADKGPKVGIRKIDFKENDRFKDGELEAQLTNADVYVDEDFTKDLQNVINYYNSRGFLKAKIVQKVVTFDERKKKIDIIVVVDEGPQTVVQEIRFANNTKRSASQLSKAIAKMDERLAAGEPFNPFLMQKIKAVLLAEYFKQGYAKARVKEKVEFSEDSKSATITFSFTEGIQYFFGKLYLRGNKLTKKHVVRRELVIAEGDPYNFDKVFRSEQSLIQLGFFNSVDISPVSPDLDSPVVDMIVTVDERKMGYITGGVGYNTFAGYSAAYETGHRNLAGHGRRISFRVEAAVKEPESFRLSQRASIINFTWPWVARVPLDATVTVKDTELSEIAYDVRAFTFVIGTELRWKKMMNFLEATHPKREVRESAARNHGFFDPFTNRVEWEFAKEYIFNIDDVVQDQEQGEITISTLSPMIIHDLRDNQFNPTRWTYNTLRLDYGATWWLSQISYLKTSGQTSWYLPIFEVLPFLDGWVFGESIAVAHLQSLRDTDTVPISRRLFLGGSTTIRGFGQNQISPTGDDGKTPVGGYFMAYQNTELRIPFKWSTGFLLFFDAGDVTGGTNNFDIEQVRATGGLGYRYITPIGPISADYGIKLNRQEDESLGEFYITIGNAF